VTIGNNFMMILRAEGCGEVRRLRRTGLIAPPVASRMPTAPICVQDTADQWHEFFTAAGLAPLV
jgi:hypothetical protein